MNARANKWLGIAALMIALGMSAWSAAIPVSSGAAEAAAPPSGDSAARSASIPIFQGGPIRRESLPPTQGGAERLSGPASAFQDLIEPLFGVNYRANTDPSTTLAQQEPSIAVNPLNPLNVVAAAKDEREGTNTKHVYIYTSTDGGVTWINQRFPYREPAPPYSSDPVVNFTDDGICYVTSLPYGGGAEGIQIARSNDGGITFETATQVTPNPDADKEWTWIDNFPSSPYYHRMYVAWRNFGTGADITLNYSSDRGQTWSSERPVAVTAYQFPMPVVLPDGTVLVSYLTGAYGNTLTVSRSTNGGVNFGGAQVAAGVTAPNCPPDNPGCSIWRLAPIPSTAVDPTDGSVIIAWADGAAQTSTIYYIRGSANGTVWSAPALLAPPGGSTVYQVEPWVEADEQGTFHAIWYDDRESPNTSIFHLYYSQSTDDGQTWSTAQRISTASSDLRIGVPSGYARAAGDYIQVAASHGNIYAAWTDTRSGTGEDIYVVRGMMPITSTPTLTPQTTQTATATTSPTNTLVPPTSTATSTATAIITPCPIQFTDVPPTNTFYENVRCLACRGIISGYSDGTFRPNNPVTRGQLAKMVSNSAGFAEVVSGQTFEDVPPTNTFYEWIERLTTRGYMTGYVCGGPGEPCTSGRPYFRPFANATRGQTAKIVANAAMFTEPPVGQTFEDVPPTHTFFEFIQRLATRNVMQGYECGGPFEPCLSGRPYFRPQNDVTRGQSAKIVANTFFPDCNTP